MPDPIAILAAMEQEIRLIEARLHDPAEQLVLGRRFVTGTLSGVPVVTAISGLGKVAAGATVATVLERFGPTHVVFGGVAGGIGANINIGDVVVADTLVQHDFDASPIFDRFVVPSLGVAEIPTDPELTDQVLEAAARYLGGRFQDEVNTNGLAHLAPAKATIHRGLVASGDRFVDHEAQARTLLSDLPNVLAVEMEGAAVAQVCAERGVPFAVFRSISDRADQNANVDFRAFITSFAAPITAGLVEEFVSELTIS